MTGNRHFLAYATANDPGGYLLDADNIRRMTRLSSGVGALDIVLAVSEVNPASRQDEHWYRKLAHDLTRSGHRVHEVIFKPNIGRDFSSWAACLAVFRRLGGPEDFAFLVNRSAHGPMLANWYGAYRQLLEHNSGLGLVGPTMNFDQGIHVQSYARMARLEVWDRLFPDFPGIAATSRKEAIRDGEVGSSRRILEMGFGLACLAWPGEIFHQNRRSEPSLPQFDISWHVRGLPHRHVNTSDRHRAFFSLRSRLAYRFYGSPA